MSASAGVSPMELMALPFAECLVLVGIHSYLGQHVLRRQVIFVDLALAQIAALGTTIAFLFGIDPMSKGSYVFSLIATALGAAVFSLTRFHKNKVPQEAIIGLVYALATAMGILIVAQAPHGAEHIQKVLTGQLLWVRPGEVIAAASVYAAVGVFHFIFRAKFNAISRDPEQARADGINVRLWDFLFYLSFGLVITHSVRTAGVLLVFVFLVVPAIMGRLITDRTGVQLTIGWVVGAMVSFTGLSISYAADTSTGPTVVSLYGAVLLVVAIVVWLLRSGSQWRAALTRLGVGLAVVAAIGLGLDALGTWMSKDPFWAGEGSAHAAVASVGHPDHHHHHHSGAVALNKTPAADPEGVVCEGDCAITPLLDELEPLDIDARAERLAKMKDPVLVAELLHHVDPKEEELALVVARRLTELDHAKGAKHLVTLMGHSATPLIRDEALSALRAVAGDDFGFDPWDEPTAQKNSAALERWRGWLDKP